MPARKRQTQLKMGQLFANALGASGDLEAERVLIGTCANCLPLIGISPAGLQAHEVLKSGTIWQEMAFCMVVREI